MNYKDYYTARNSIVEIMKKDWLGPVKEDEIICDESPLSYYILGKLYPQNDAVSETEHSPSEDCGIIDEEISISLSNSKNPSSFGLSFSLNSTTSSFQIIPHAAQYKLLCYEDAKSILNFSDNSYSKNANFWKRVELPLSPIIIQTDNLIHNKIQTFILDNHLIIKVILHKIYSDGTKTISVTMINQYLSSKHNKENCLHSFFQPKIEIKSDCVHAFIDIRRNIVLTTDKAAISNPEISELEMLYNDTHNYASGHGCAVSWKTNEEGFISSLSTEFLPEYEVKQMMPTASFQHKVLEMHFLATASYADVKEGLTELTQLYNAWISNQEQLLKSLPLIHHVAAKKNINKCLSTLNVLKKSIISMEDPIVFRAFKLANKAMFLQRKQMLLNAEKYTSDENIKWYPFQLAFFLQEIISFADPTSTERKSTDLLWFPTGGGKTEAYLGISAFVIFLRRLRNPEVNSGITVLMRYTLRLLSFQQFERASALICACEIIRREENIPGEEISIGLWVGSALTPNSIEKAQKILNGEPDCNSPDSNPAQFEKCPWCGSSIPLSCYSCNIDKKRMTIFCNNPKCHFHKGLPIYLIDEEIYEYSPTFLVSTVDKFAQLALNPQTFSLFGQNSNQLPPELIIQDELHLISGPLGTITALYEAAIDKLCVSHGIPPKIVVSTATIRNAKEQIKSLYNTGYTQFPPQGININDSFFAEISKREQKPARLYLGCMAVGTSPTTMMIRVMSSLLFATRYLIEQGYDEKIIDSFWTLTGYFNTLRELGGAIVRVVDDIQDRFNYLRNSKFKKIYPLGTQQKRYDHYKELTSREKSENIGKIIQTELKTPYKADGSTNPYDFLLSSNMISVGVDVGRLGTMVVVGQPKTTSEYIQATSRVGRETPGLVIATYNQAKSRDRSHYEDFIQYHSTFYKFVEATSITPFSDRARDRALQALYIILCRNNIPNLRFDDCAVNFSKDIPELDEIRNYILSYVKSVDPAEVENTSSDLDEIEEEWDEKSSLQRSSNKPLRYCTSKWIDQSESLFQPDYNESSRFRVLNTMRSVETTVKVLIRE